MLDAILDLLSELADARVGVAISFALATSPSALALSSQ